MASAAGRSAATTSSSTASAANDIKYTRAGGTIAIGAEVDPEGENLAISVEDTGPGIAPEDQVRIFEQMYQAPGDIRASRKGLGLGLYIAKCIVQGHGGRIWAERRTGKGSTFCFTLPIHVAE